VLAIAHRGASGYAPENTLAAFRRAVSQGVSFIETDLHLTRDAHFVAIHDDTVDRTTGGHGAVNQLTLAEIRRLDAGSWFASEFIGERIPTLTEILEFTRKHDVVFYLELKPTGFWGGEHALISSLRESGEIPRVIVISFDAAILAALRKIEPTLMTGLLHDGKIRDPFEQALEIGARQLAVRGDLVTPNFLKEAHKRDLQVVCWTINSPAHMRLLEASGVDGSGHKGVAERVHRQKRRHASRVPKIVGIHAFGHGRAGGGLNRDQADLLPSRLEGHEGESQAGKVASSATAANHHVREGSGEL
jgi:glycerophosphoryl diester phosphodiesterase